MAPWRSDSQKMKRQVEQENVSVASDEQLVSLATSSSDPVSILEELFRRYERSTLAFFICRVGDRGKAEDLNQELYLKLTKTLATYRHECSWRTWVHIVARSILAQSRAERWGRLADRLVTVDEEVLGRDLQLHPLPDDAAEQALLRKQIGRCLLRLSDAERSVVVNHFYRGVTLRELTNRLQLTNPSGSRAILISALRKLRRCLERGRGR